jgi:hypothetical protein
MGAEHPLDAVQHQGMGSAPANLLNAQGIQKTSPINPAGYELAFTIGRAGIEDQAATLKDTRDRAGVLATTAAAIATLAGGLAFRNLAAVKLSWWGYTGLVAGGVGFVIALVCTIMVWRPIVGTFRLDSRIIAEQWVERDPPMSIEQIHKWLAIYLGNHAAGNRVQIDARLQWFSVGLIGLGVETGGLIAMLLDAAS